MKKIFCFIYLLISSYLANSQSVVFSFSTVDNGNGTSTISVYANTTTGTEQLYAYTVALFYDNTLATATSFTDAALPWSFDGTFTSFTSNGSQPGFNGYMELQRIDATGVGTIINTTPLLLSTITYTQLSNPAGDTYIANTNDLPAISYLSLSGDGEFPIVTTGVVQQPLPITLKTFEVKHSGKRDALLNWVTASEVNASHFEIERKKDSDQSWEYLASVEAANNTYVETTYEYLDNDLPINRSNETFYYHLKMVDTDGSYKYSEIRSLSFGIIDEFSAVMYPNPCRDYLKLETVTGINLYSDFAKVKIYNSNGNTVFEKIISSNGINDLDLNDLPAGAYNVQIYIANHVIVKKLMVIK